MKKFQFRLQRLLWYHQQRQKQADVQLQQAAWQRDMADEGVLAVHRQIASECQLLDQHSLTADISVRQNAMLHLDRLDRDLTAAREKLKLADQRLRETQKVRADITQEVEALVHLRSQQQMEHRDEVARLQQIVLDEVVMRQWSMRDSDLAAESVQSGD